MPSLQDSVWLKVNPSRPHASQKFFRRQRGGPTWIAATLAVGPRAANAITEITLIAAGAANFSSAAFFGTSPADCSALHRPDAHAVLKGDGVGAIRDGAAWRAL